MADFQSIQSTINSTEDEIRKIFSDYMRMHPDVLMNIVPSTLQDYLASHPKKIDDINHQNQLAEYMTGYQINSVQPATDPAAQFTEYFTSHGGEPMDTGKMDYGHTDSTFYTKATQTLNSWGVKFPGIFSDLPSIGGGETLGLNRDSIINMVEAIGSTEVAATFGTNLGESEGPLFIVNKGALSATGKAAIGNLFTNGMSIIAAQLTNGSSINPGVKKLAERLKTFNFGSDPEDTPTQKYVSRMDPSDDKYVDLNWKINPKTGDAQKGGDANVWGVLMGTNSVTDLFKKNAQDSDRNIKSVDTAWKETLSNNGIELSDLYTNWGSDAANQNWITKNLKPGNENNWTVTGSMTNGNIDSANSNSIEEVKKLTDQQQFAFLFEEVSSENPSYCTFPATIKPPSESFSPEFSPSNSFFGRSEKAAIYSGTNRTIQFEFSLVVWSEREFRDYKSRINWLAQRTYAKYHEDNNGLNSRIPLYKKPPLIRITLGDLYNRLGGYITSLTIAWGQPQEMWEKFMEKNKIPLTCSITMGFTVLHDFIPDGDSSFWGWTYKNQDEGNNTNITNVNTNNIPEQQQTNTESEVQEDNKNENAGNQNPNGTGDN